MSGGVDSSVAAKLLVDSGYDVMGVTLKLFDDDGVVIEGGSRTCCSLEDVEDARSVAFGLGIPYHVFNYRDSFGACVVDKFCESYLRGRTPNPCIDCNRYLKFGALQQRREELGFDFVATGHYARRDFDPSTGRYLLKKGLDPRKDQSYVLYHLTQEQLAHMLFPVGELSKPQVREVARSAGLSTADKSESQDICFVPDGDYASFIESHTGKGFTPGPIVDESGKVLGMHSGLPHYTIGQRKGLGVAVGEPLFVLAKDPATNTITVGPSSSASFCRVFAQDVNLVSIPGIDEPIRVQVKVNYRSSPKDATAYMEGRTLIVDLDQPVRAVAPGQAIVLYQDDVVLGGGTIERAE